MDHADTITLCGVLLTPSEAVKLRARFFAKVDQSGGPDGCWLWIAGKSTTGYGKFGVGYTPCYAHRVSYELARGHIPEGLCLLHSCDTPLCVNPAHLNPGTKGDNAADRDRKGRTAKGEARPEARLTESAVLEIRAARLAGESYGAIAARLGVRPHAVGKVARFERWRHVA